MTSYLEKRRSGERPRTTPTNPHTQLDQNAPGDLQERVFDFAKALNDVVVGPSHVSVPGTRAFHLPKHAHHGVGCCMMHGEFAHLHPRSDGSLHMTVPAPEADRIVDNGWAERHPLAGKHGLGSNLVMVYGPRDEDELGVVIDLVRAAYDNAAVRA